MIGCKILILLIVISLNISEVYLFDPPASNSAHALIHVTHDKAMFLIGIAAAVIWFVKGVYSFILTFMELFLLYLF
jgi:hypothetical protein